MKIEIEYPAIVIDTKDERVTDTQVISSLNGMQDKNANLSDYLSSTFEDLGVNGGTIELKVDSRSHSLSSIVGYNIGEPLSHAHLKQLIDETTDQLTDGYGETPWEVRVNGQKLLVGFIDILSERKHPTSVSTIESLPFLNKIKRSPIFSALEKGDLEKAGKYLDRSTLFCTDKWGYTPLMYAINHGHAQIAIEMIKLGSNVNHLAEKSGATPLSTAAMSGDVEIGKALIDYGANVNNAPVDPDGMLSGMTALMWAANRNFAPFVKLLLASGADVNKINGNNQTALMFAAKGTPEQIEIFDLIIQQKPILDIKDWRGRSIIDEARDRSKNSNKHEMKNLITQYYPEIIF